MAGTSKNDFNATELFNMMAGKEVGRGCYRTVYVFKPDPTLVLKVAEEDPRSNVIEHHIWTEVEYAEHLAKWFAPVVSISQCGVYLLQKRVEVGRAQDYPEKIPAWFVDIKRENWGWLEDHWVCCDYGNAILTPGLGKRLKKAEWGER